MKHQVLIVGAGNMGSSHALAYHKHSNCQIVGIVSQGNSKEKLNKKLGGNYPLFSDYYHAMKQTFPNLVVVSTYLDTHYDFVRYALEKGAHVFVEKPMCPTVEQVEELIDLSLKKKLKLMVGLILRHHPGWKRFIKIAQTLGKPLVMRMNLNQQSSGQNWEVHRQLLKEASPVFDCGIHYVDIMGQMVNEAAVRVSGMGTRLTESIIKGRKNYGHLQVTFADGSIGWYEAGWGPMMSETAFFVKDVIGPKGSVSIVDNEKLGSSAQVKTHVSNQLLRLHHAELNEEGNFIHQDELIPFDDAPGHDQLCEAEQLHLLRAIEENIDLEAELRSGVTAMNIVIAADQSSQSGEMIHLGASS